MNNVAYARSRMVSWLYAGVQTRLHVSGRSSAFRAGPIHLPTCGLLQARTKRTVQPHLYSDIAAQHV